MIDLELAHKYGITVLDSIDLEDYASLSDGCSGGLSWAYSLAGKKISCHNCCVAHDFLYSWGGTEEDRKKADKLLRDCAAKAGGGGAWRWFRAQVMYAAVRMFAASHWEK